jgi:hypothetical protein
MRPALELVNREASAHVCGLADSMGREPSLPRARDIGSIVVEIQDLAPPPAENSRACLRKTAAGLNVVEGS